jgi:predicted nucleic acid-binding protein
MIVVADTSPLNYLIQIEYDYLLPRLYRTVLVPEGVIVELRREKAPPR